MISEANRINLQRNVSLFTYMNFLYIRVYKTNIVSIERNKKDTK